MFAGGAQDAILRRWSDIRFEIVLSQHLIDELDATLQKEFFVTRSRDNVSQRLEASLREEEWTTIGLVEFRAASHFEDDLVLATALSGKADFVVTGDKQLLKLGQFEGIRIVDSHAFLEILDRQAAKFGDRPTE